MLLTPALTGAMSLVGDLWDSWREAPEGEISFIQGETRAGKTTALDEFMLEKHAEHVKLYAGREGYEVSPLADNSALWALEIRTPSGWLRPIIKVQVPKKAKYKALFEAVLFTLMNLTKIPARMSTEKYLLQILVKQLHEQQTRVIIFDECHHISEFRNPDGAYDAGDVFKNIAKCGRTGVVCTGLPHMMEIADANPQVRESERDRFTVAPFPLDLAAGSDLRMFMTALNEQLPFDQPSCLADDDVIYRIALLRDGFAGRIARFVQQVTGYALSVGAPCIDMPTLKAFLRVKKGVADAENIFLMSRDEAADYPAAVQKALRMRALQAQKRRGRHAARQESRHQFGARE
ncbi:TniB family NTP-binding protein [Bradyrhizobium sp. LB11.1]|uniref:TniB family NTP-binding protein n=1 Tax=Bradyrhizobium sp. LB11.1 TaxID=3156326 RepID=UPI003396F331